MSKGEKYYMSIGYPIGLCEGKESERTYNVELNGRFIGLSQISYEIWKECFFDIKNRDFLFNSIRDRMKVDNILINLQLESLKEHKLIVEIDSNDIEKIYNKLSLLAPMKNGFGIGLNSEGSNASVINQGKPFKLSINEFNVWAVCDNRKLIKNIVKDFCKEQEITEDMAKYTVLNAILKLKTLDLLRINLKL